MTDGMQYVTEVCVCVGGVDETSKAVVTAIMRVCDRGGYMAVVCHSVHTTGPCR
jgi:hypothetical protein